MYNYEKLKKKKRKTTTTININSILYLFHELYKKYDIFKMVRLKIGSNDLFYHKLQGEM